MTYIFIPQFGSFILPDWLMAVFYLFFLWWIGNGLEQAMGSFRMNLYYITGMIGITIASFFEAFLSGGSGGGFSAALLNSSLLFAFAHYYPDEVIFVMYVIPAKVKWLAWLGGALLFYHFLGAGWSYRISLIVALANYFIFFGPEMYPERPHPPGGRPAPAQVRGGQGAGHGDAPRVRRLPSHRGDPSGTGLPRGARRPRSIAATTCRKRRRIKLPIRPAENQIPL